MPTPARQADRSPQAHANLSNDAIGAQGGDFLRVVTGDLAQDPFGVLAERGRAGVGCPGSLSISPPDLAAVLSGEPGTISPSKVGWSACRIIWRSCRWGLRETSATVAIGAHGTPAYQQFEPVIARLGAEVAAEYWLEFGVVRCTVGIECKARIALQFRHSDGVAEAHP